VVGRDVAPHLWREDSAEVGIVQATVECERPWAGVVRVVPPAMGVDCTSPGRRRGGRSCVTDLDVCNEIMQPCEPPSAAGFTHNNICDDNGEDGINVFGQAHPLLHSNTCRANKGSGIGYVGGTAGLARDNICARVALGPPWPAVARRERAERLGPVGGVATGECLPIRCGQPITHHLGVLARVRQVEGMGPGHGLRGVVIPGEELLPGRVLGAERPRQAKVQVGTALAIASALALVGRPTLTAQTVEAGCPVSSPSWPRCPVG
jgi:hypothetical protein